MSERNKVTNHWAVTVRGRFEIGMKGYRFYSDLQVSGLGLRAI
jgi:hypothetical protein